MRETNTQRWGWVRERKMRKNHENVLIKRITVNLSSYCLSYSGTGMTEKADTPTNQTI